MTIDDLLEHWARWRAIRESNGLSYATSRLAVLMGGGIVCGSGNSSLPYGVDADSAGAVMDRAICRLPLRRRQVVAVEYCKIGKQAAKAAGMKPPYALQSYRDALCLARKELSKQPDVKKLLTA